MKLKDITDPINKGLNSDAFKAVMPVQALAQGATKAVTGLDPTEQYATGAAGGSLIAGGAALAGSGGAPAATTPAAPASAGASSSVPSLPMVPNQPPPQQQNQMPMPPMPTMPVYRDPRPSVITPTSRSFFRP